MKRVIEQIACDICSLNMVSGEEYEVYGSDIHVHNGCVRKLPDWMQYDPEFFIRAIVETRNMENRVNKPDFRNFIDGTIDPNLFYVFVCPEEEHESGWICVCNSLKAIEALWIDLPANQPIEGVLFRGKFREIHAEVKITMSDKEA